MVRALALLSVIFAAIMLGHTSAKVTLDTYADLFDDHLDAVAESLHSRYSPSARIDLMEYARLPTVACSSNVTLCDPPD